MKPSFNLSFIDEIGKAIIPKKIRPVIRQYLLKAGISEVPFRTFGILFFLFIIITIFIFFRYIAEPLVESYSGIKLAIFAFLGGFLTASGVAIVFFGLIYLYFETIIYNRTKEMEEVLQDFLKFVSENLKGGLSFEKALWAAIKPEFGSLATEVRLAAKKVMTGQSIEEALLEFTEKYDSPLLKRSFALIIEGLKGGGRIAELIDRVVDNIEETRLLKKEMAATNLTYVIFISFIVIAIAPALFALSYQLLIIVSNFVGKIGGIEYTQTYEMSLPFSVKGISIKPEEFINFSRIALTIIALFSSMIISIIRKGEIRDGIIYFPLYILGSLVMYSVFMILLEMIFKTLILI